MQPLYLLLFFLELVCWRWTRHVPTCSQLRRDYGVLTREHGPRFVRKFRLALQEAAETVGFDEEVHVGRWLGFPVGGDQTVEVVSDRLARLGQVKRDRRKTVSAIEHAVCLHTLAGCNAGQPSPFLIGKPMI